MSGIYPPPSNSGTGFPEVKISRIPSGFPRQHPSILRGQIYPPTWWPLTSSGFFLFRLFGCFSENSRGVFHPNHPFFFGVCFHYKPPPIFRGNVSLFLETPRLLNARHPSNSIPSVHSDVAGPKIPHDSAKTMRSLVCKDHPRVKLTWLAGKLQPFESMHLLWKLVIFQWKMLVFRW